MSSAMELTTASSFGVMSWHGAAEISVPYSQPGKSECLRRRLTVTVMVASLISFCISLLLWLVVASASRRDADGTVRGRGDGARGRGDSGGTVWGYAGRRAKRLLPTYFFWSGVFIAATCAFDLILDGGRLNPKYGTVGFWIRVIFLGDASTHLWFLPCLLYAQVVMKALEWVAARTECGPYRVGVPCLGLGLGLCAISCWLGNWFGTYPLRLFAFLVTGYGLGRMEVKLPRAWSGGLTVVGLVAYVLLDGVVPAFVRGWFVTVPLLGFLPLLQNRARV